MSSIMDTIGIEKTSHFIENKKNLDLWIRNHLIPVPKIIRSYGNSKRIFFCLEIESAVKTYQFLRADLFIQKQ